MTKIKFKISKTGKVTIEVDGVEGASCKDITAAFETALGKVEDVKQKEEYFIELDPVFQEIYEE